MHTIWFAYPLRSVYTSPFNHIHNFYDKNDKNEDNSSTGATFLMGQLNLFRYSNSAAVRENIL